MPRYIADNLNKSIALRPYQEEALKHFLFYDEDHKERANPAHLLFHMATGSGKTVLMAAIIIYLYQKGYRNFLFFVNSSNIIQKTKGNFLNPASSKYLFADFITLDGKQVNIREVSNFDEAVGDDIYIHFTTIQGLHTRMTTPKENSVTSEDFKNRKIVLISDEAHHINTLTKSKLTQEETENKKSWESTVQCIFKTNMDNLLLEFTATIDMGNQNIKEKYNDKLLYDYSLKQFRVDKYSKEISLRQSYVDPVERMFQAIMFSQYRRKVSEKNRLQIKPVIMMKSKTIRESNENTTSFNNLINTLTPRFIENSRSKTKKDPSLKKTYDYLFDELKLSYENFVLEIKEDFSSNKIINVNDLETYQIQVNSLEDYDNEIRVVFAVDKLNEGWDVLNLFDIVRLYDTRDSKNNKPGKTTMQEAQLIGRGARYCPFIDPDQPDLSKEKRKYDKKVDNPLRALEELYYHCSHNPEYIREIKSALQKTGIMGEPQRELLLVKESFKKTDFYEEGRIYSNEKIEDKNLNKKNLADYGVRNFYSYPHILTSAIREDIALTDTHIERGSKNLKKEEFILSEFGKPVLRRAADGIDFFFFDNLKKYLPHLKSKNCFFKKIESYIIEAEGDLQNLATLSQKQKKDMTHFMLSEIEKKIRDNSQNYSGSREFKSKKIKETVLDKNVYIDDKNKLASLEKANLFSGEWYIYEKNPVNKLEQKFIKYIRDHADEIEKKHGKFYLLRNESILKIYNFSDGRGFEPDFVLFLKKDKDEKKIIFHLFIEPKGEHLIEHDGWKEDFLEEIEKTCQYSDIADGADYKIIGLPLYTEQDRTFEERFEKLFLDNEE